MRYFRQDNSAGWTDAELSAMDGDLDAWRAEHPEASEDDTAREVERILFLARQSRASGTQKAAQLGEISALKAENARLREALDEVAELTDWPDSSAEARCYSIRLAARAALAEGGAA